MTRILAVGTHATDDPTRASLPFITASGAVTAHKEVAIALVGDAAFLAKSEVMNSIQGVGFPALSGVVPTLLDAGVRIYI